MNKIILAMAMGMSLFLVGCAAWNQAVTDYKTGSSTPLVNGEIAPSAQGAIVQNTVASLPIPFSGPIALALGGLVTVFFTWKRGVSIRTNGGAPAATAATSSVSTNGILQDVANIFSGMFTTASTTVPTTAGSVFQRIWKVAVATLASGAALAAANPSFMSYLTGHPYLDALFVSASAGIAGVEKALSAVPVPTVPTTTVAA